MTMLNEEQLKVIEKYKNRLDKFGLAYVSNPNLSVAQMLEVADGLSCLLPYSAVLQYAKAELSAEKMRAIKEYLYAVLDFKKVFNTLNRDDKAELLFYVRKLLLNEFKHEDEICILRERKSKHVQQWIWRWTISSNWKL